MLNLNNIYWGTMWSLLTDHKINPYEIGLNISEEQDVINGTFNSPGAPETKYRFAFRHPESSGDPYNEEKLCADRTAYEIATKLRPWYHEVYIKLAEEVENGLEPN